MAPRLPTANDFDSAATVAIIAPPQSQRPTNALVLLHGLGDAHDPFAKLAQQLALPETVCIALQAPMPMPFDLGGFHWGDDIVFDQATGSIDPDTGFEKAASLLVDVVRTSLIDQCGFKERAILFLGFGQGGMAALSAASKSKNEFAGVVSIGGPIPASCKPSQTKSRTPIIVLGGSSRSLITHSAVKRIKDLFEFVQIHQWNRPGDGMPTSRDEMLPIMQFFARRLQSQAGVPHGSVELF